VLELARAAETKLVVGENALWDSTRSQRPHNTTVTWAEM